jgi:hypothetical protein
VFIAGCSYLLLWRRQQSRNTNPAAAVARWPSKVRLPVIMHGAVHEWVLTAAAHPSSAVSGRAMNPKGLSFRQSLRSCASRALATPLQLHSSKTAQESTAQEFKPGGRSAFVALHGVRRCAPMQKFIILACAHLMLLGASRQGEGWFGALFSSANSPPNGLNVRILPELKLLVLHYRVPNPRA